MPELSRRDFARLMALTGSAALLPGASQRVSSTLPPAPAEPDEKYWRQVRDRFLLPRDLIFLNAANLCPASVTVIDALEKHSRFLDANPSPASRSVLGAAREASRRAIAASLRVTPEDIVITRNTSEANNLVSSGLRLGPGDEVVVFSDNHPSNLRAWHEKAKHRGFAVVEVPAQWPHPGAERYLEAFRDALTSRTRVLAVTHVTSSFGDVLPVRELCGMARSRGVLSMVDGAQSFGALDVDLSVMQPDFYSGSAHKWPCGPRETGVLYVHPDAHDRLAPSIVSLYPGAVGVSRTLEAYGQRDEAALAALAAAFALREEIGGAVIERRVRQLATHLVTELARIPGVTVWTDAAAAHRAGIVVFGTGSVSPRSVVDALNQERIVGTVSGNSGRPGVRFSPHVYNTLDELDRVVRAVSRHAA